MDALGTHGVESGFAIRIVGRDFGYAPGPEMRFTSFDVEVIAVQRKERICCSSADALNYCLWAIRATFEVINGVELEWPALPHGSRKGEDRAATTFYDVERGVITGTQTETYGEVAI